jgi:Domain of unknown function (DUF4214)
VTVNAVLVPAEPLAAGTETPAAQKRWRALQDMQCMSCQTVRLPGGNASDYVTGLYEAALGRAPDPAGLAYYSGQVQQGITRFYRYGMRALQDMRCMSCQTLDCGIMSYLYI